MGRTRKYKHKNRKHKTKKLLRGGKLPKGVPQGEAAHIKTKTHFRERTLENGSTVKTVKSSSPIQFTPNKSIFIYTDANTGIHYAKNPNTKKLFTNPGLQEFISSKISRQIANTEGSLYENPEQFRLGAAKAKNEANKKELISSYSELERQQKERQKSLLLKKVISAFSMGKQATTTQSPGVTIPTAGESNTNGKPNKTLWRTAQSVLSGIKSKKKSGVGTAPAQPVATVLRFENSGNSSTDLGLAMLYGGKL